MYFYLKALHIIFVVTWFAGIFYMPRLFIYNTEANEKNEAEKNILQKQFGIMMRRLWYGITWPSAILTFILGLSVLFDPAYKWYKIVLQPEGRWLLVKLCFVLLLYAYHLSLHYIFRKQINGVFNHSSQQLRIWNEVATVFLVSIVTLVTVKDSLSFIWSLAGLVLFVVILMAAIKIYKIIRNKKQ